MARKRKLPVESSIRELMVAMGHDPVRNLLLQMREEIPLENEDELQSPVIISMLNSGYEIAKSSEGKLILRLALKHRLEIDKELIGYLHPKLRSAEVKESKDLNITIKIQSFGQNKEKVLDVAPVRALLEEEIKQ